MKKPSQKMYKSSVIIPAYNESDYLEECLEALLAQTVPLYEIIVVDNNSTDGSIQHAEKKFETVRFINEREQGIVFARNTGFSSASGDLLIKLDADTIVDEQWHESLQAELQSSGASAWSGYVSSDEVLPQLRRFGELMFNSITFIGMRVVSGTTPLFGCNMAMTKHAWNLIKNDVSMRNDIWEDLDMAVLLGQNNVKVYNSKKTNVRISSRSANVKPLRFYRRLYGQPRVYLIHKKYISYAASIVLMHVSFLGWLLSWPFARLGQSLATRPRLDQY